MIKKYVKESAKHGGNNNMLNTYPCQVPKRIMDLESSSSDDEEQNVDDGLTEEERAVVLEMRQTTQEIDQNETQQKDIE